MFTHCESAQISIKTNKNIELTIPFVQLPNHVCFQTTNYDANINAFKNRFPVFTNSQSFLTCLFQLNPFHSVYMVLWLFNNS